MNRRKGYSHGVIAGVLIVSLFSSVPAAATDFIESISADKLDQYSRSLSPGYKALLQKYKTFKLPLYASTQLPKDPPSFVKATDLGMGSVSLVGIESLSNYRNGIPFPEPSSAIQLIWNHRLRWRGPAWHWSFDHAEVKPDGAVTTIRVNDYFIDRRPNDLVREGHLFARAWEFSYPDGRPRQTNQDAAIWREQLDTSNAGFRTNWFAFENTFLRRAVVIPEERHLIGGFMLRYYDMIDMFSPPYSGYTFKLIGKRRFVVPYDASDLHTDRASLLLPHHPETSYLRYELKNVWVVEVDALPENDHPIRRRRFYIDPMSWEILLSESYDRDGILTLVHECHLSYNRNIEASNCRPQFIYSLTDERYLATNLKSGADFPVPELAELNPSRVQRRAQK